MMTTTAELDWHISEGERLRDKGMQAAAAAQGQEWLGKAYEAIVTIAKHMPKFSVDDVLRIFTDQPRHPNAWGAVWRRARKEGIIISTGEIIRSTIPRKHRRFCLVYESTIYEGTHR